MRHYIYLNTPSNVFSTGGKQVLETLSVVDWILLAFSMLLAILAAAFIVRKAKEELKIGRMVQGITGIIVFVAVGLICSGLLVAPIGMAIGLRAPPEVAPPVGPEVQNVGYAQAVVTDQYMIPTTPIQDAIVQATLQTPMPGQAIIEVTSENSNTDGSALLKLDGVTSGAIWVVAHKSGYYTDVEQTSIPGAQVYPSEALWATPELAKIGTLSLDISDNSAEWDSSTNTITENLTTTNAHYFTIELTVSAAYEALRDMQVAFIRGSDWDNLGASPLVVTVVDDAGTAIGTVGDITLSADISADLNAVGDLDYSVVLKIKVRTNTAHDSGDKELLRIMINDLGAGVGYAGDVGIDPTEIRVKTTV